MALDKKQKGSWKLQTVLLYFSLKYVEIKSNRWKEDRSQNRFASCPMFCTPLELFLCFLRCLNTFVVSSKPF